MTCSIRRAPAAVLAAFAAFAAFGANACTPGAPPPAPGGQVAVFDSLHCHWTFVKLFGAVPVPVPKPLPSHMVLRGIPAVERRLVLQGK